MDKISLREFCAIAEAHGEYHGAKEKTKSLTNDDLDEMGVGDKVIITDFRGGKDANRD